MSALLSSCPRLTKLTIPVNSMAFARIVDEELRKARGGAAPILECLTFEPQHRAFSPGAVFAEVQRRFPDLAELRTSLALDTSVVSSRLDVKRLVLRCAQFFSSAENSEDRQKARATALAQTIAASCPKLESLDVALESAQNFSNISVGSTFLAALGESNVCLRHLTLRNVETAHSSQEAHVTPAVIAALVNDAPGQIANFDLILRKHSLYSRNIDDGMAEAKAVAIAAIPNARPDLRVRVGYDKNDRYNKNFSNMNEHLQWL